MGGPLHNLTVRHNWPQIRYGVPSDTLAAPARPMTAPDVRSLGLILPTFPQDRVDLPGAMALADLCRRAEAGGAGALWVCDHVFWHGPALEALSALGVAATATSRAAIGTCILQLPLRHAPSVAKEAASLDHLSAGRLILGVGIDTLRRSWAVSPGQRYAQLPAVGPVPVWVGGSSEAALRRAAHRGDG